MSVPLVVWRICDGKPGHDRQTGGLVSALEDEVPLIIHSLPATAAKYAPWLAWRRRFPAGAALPDPDLVLGAGRACQWPMLAARRARGGRAVYLMNPALPRRCFDLCLVPRHDGVPAGATVELTTGVLNDVRRAAARSGRTLVLIGGPSRHHGWDEAALLRQVASIVFGSRERDLVITDSRRTPPGTAAALTQFARPGVRVVSHCDTPPEWLPGELSTAAAVWVTADSVSMIFEAWTAGAALGLIEVPARRDDRISRLAGKLCARGVVTPMAEWLVRGELRRPPVLAEAERCARLLVRRWFPERARMGNAPC